MKKADPRSAGHGILFMKGHCVPAMSNSRIRYLLGLGVAAVLSPLCPPQLLRAQDLAPRAYVITPLHSNAVLLTYSFYDGSINFNGALPVSDAKGKYSVPIFSYYHSSAFLAVRPTSWPRCPTELETSLEPWRERGRTCTAPVLRIRSTAFRSTLRVARRCDRRSSLNGIRSSF